MKEWFRIDLLVSVCSCKRINNSEGGGRRKKRWKIPKSHLCSFQTLKQNKSRCESMQNKTTDKERREGEEN